MPTTIPATLTSAFRKFSGPTIRSDVRLSDTTSLRITLKGDDDAVGDLIALCGEAAIVAAIRLFVEAQDSLVLSPVLEDRLCLYVADYVGYPSAENLFADMSVVYHPVETIPTPDSPDDFRRRRFGAAYAPTAA